jgi:hypothetical protein
MEDSQQSQQQVASNEVLAQRIEVLERYVEDIGVAVYNLVESLRGIAPPRPCPPLCPTGYRGEGERGE